MAEETKVVLTRLTQTCFACPSQWDGWDADDTYYYIRYRWGYLSVSKGAVRGEEIFGCSMGEPLDGFMTTEEMLVATGMSTTQVQQ